MRITREWVEGIVARVIAEQEPTAEGPLPEPPADWRRDDDKHGEECDCDECAEGDE